MTAHRRLAASRRRRTSRREVQELLRAAGLRPVPASVRLGVAPLLAADGGARGAVPSRRELRRLLRVASTHPVPSVAVSPIAPSSDLTAPPIVLPVHRRRDRRSRRPAVLTGAAAAAATLVLVGALTGVVAGPGDDAELVLGVAVDTSVLLPDGTTIHGARGLSLPDGAVVRTGPAGRAIAGDVELGPGLEAIVDAGALLPTGAPLAGPADPVTPGPADPGALAVVVGDGASPTTVVDGAAPDGTASAPAGAGADPAPQDASPPAPADASAGAIRHGRPLSVSTPPTDRRKSVTPGH